MKVLLDTGVLGQVTHPGSEQGRAVLVWMAGLLAAGVQIVIPEICDYELRRKYLHTSSLKALAKLDELIAATEFLSVDAAVWKDAAELWASCRRRGAALAPPDALDGDVILIASTLRMQGGPVVVATTNVKHLTEYLDARDWSSIAAP